MSRRSIKSHPSATTDTGDLLTPEPSAMGISADEPQLPAASGGRKKRKPAGKTSAAEQTASPPLLEDTSTLIEVVTGTPGIEVPDAPMETPTAAPLHEPSVQPQTASTLPPDVALWSGADLTPAAATVTVKQDKKASPPPALPSEGAGLLLRRAREAAGMSVDEVSHSLKLAPKQIEALEQQNFKALPARAFVRGFIRNYARLLNIDAATVLAALPPEADVPLSPAASSVKTPTREMPTMPSSQDSVIQPNTWKWLLAIAVLAVVAAVFFFMPNIESYFGKVSFMSLVKGDKAAPAAIAPEPEARPVPVEPITPSTAPATPPSIAIMADARPTAANEALPTTSAQPAISPALQSSMLELKFSADCWTEVRDSNGKLIYSALSKAGTTKTFDGQPPLLLMLGNSRGTEVLFKGQSVDLSAYHAQNVARLTLE